MWSGIILAVCVQAKERKSGNMKTIVCVCGTWRGVQLMPIVHCQPKFLKAHDTKSLVQTIELVRIHVLGLVEYEYVWASNKLLNMRTDWPTELASYTFTLLLALDRLESSQRSTSTPSRIFPCTKACTILHNNKARFALANARRPTCESFLKRAARAIVVRDVHGEHILTFDERSDLFRNWDTENLCYCFSDLFSDLFFNRSGETRIEFQNRREIQVSDPLTLGSIYCSDTFAVVFAY